MLYTELKRVLKIIFIFSVFSVVFSSCAANDFNELRTKNSLHLEFNVDSDIETTYRKLRESRLLPTFETSGELYQKSKEARIWLSNPSIGYFVLIDFEEINEKKTKVEYYARFSGWVKTGYKIKKFLNGY